MRLQRKAPRPGSGHSPSRRTRAEARGLLLPAQGKPQPAAKPPSRLCGGPRVRIRLRSEPARRSGLWEPTRPTFALTLRAMLGSRQRLTRRPVRFSFSLLSVLALLAMACFPVFANAEDASSYEYGTEVPHAANPASPVGPGGSASGGSPGRATTSGAPSGSGGSGAKAGGHGSTGSGGGAGHTSPGNGSTSTKHGNGSREAGSLNSAKPLSGKLVAAKNGGSSPLIPILIVIAVLAAVSIGVVLMRQRRQGPRSPVSPKAS